MPININPAPCENENRALEKFSAGVDYSNEYTRIQYTTQYQCGYEIAPDEIHFPLICPHWPIASKQQLQAEALAGRGGVA